MLNNHLSGVWEWREVWQFLWYSWFQATNICHWELSKDASNWLPQACYQAPLTITLMMQETTHFSSQSSLSLNIKTWLILKIFIWATKKKSVWNSINKICNQKQSFKRPPLPNVRPFYDFIKYFCMGYKPLNKIKSHEPIIK